MGNDINIRGEFWVIDGSLDFADGDIGEKGHEMIATEHVFSQYADAVDNLCRNYQIEHEEFEFDGVNVEAIENALSALHEFLTTGIRDEEQEIEPITDEQAHVLIMSYLGCNEDAYLILIGQGDSRTYVEEHEGWIAIRNHNVELYGYDNNKRKEIGEAIAEIIYEENNLTEDEYNWEEVDLYIYDIKTTRGFNVTLQDLLSNEMGVNSTLNQPPKINPQDLSKLPKLPDTTENTPRLDKSPSKVDKWTQAARDKGLGFHPPWKGTSESVISFYEWVGDLFNEVSQFHPEHMSQLGVINPAHVTDTVRNLATQLEEARIKLYQDLTPEQREEAWGIIRGVRPILADALQDAGVADEPFLQYLRSDTLWNTKMDLVISDLANKHIYHSFRWDKHLKNYKEERLLKNAHEKVVGKNSDLPVGYIIRRVGGGSSGMRGNPPPGEIWYRPYYSSGRWADRSQEKQGRPLTKKELLQIIKQRKRPKEES